ncbi:heme biosynthesis protein HemY [Alkalilacustris brevis]|uniref:heme biosynthesis protein HemY n=1 Tax=Alkalilacustris brevis TaxID=2026338 RepID=UPI000E0D0FF9|nr:heme biosynthesis HemY N-terminal domain-containing protein [Alkalilacustris brevis]
MLWSLLKIILFIAAVAALALGAERLLDSGDGLRIAVAGLEFTLGPLQTLVAVFLLLLTLWLILKLAGLTVAVLRFLNGDETAISRFFARNRERRGFQALVDGMMALASGEPTQAMTKVAKAEKLLGRPELTNLISAQAAEMQGDTRRAISYYKKLLDDKSTKFVGVRGLLRQKLAEGDTDKALKLAQKAFTLKPGHDETQQVLLDLQAQKRDWTGARETLLARKHSGALPKDIYRRRDAVLALQAADDFRNEGKPRHAGDAAIEANRLSPDLVPAAIAAARTWIERETPRKAAKILKNAWAAAPHPELAAAFAEIAPDEPPAERLKRFRPLLTALPDHPETRMLQAELLIAAEDFPAARRAMGTLTESHPVARVFTIMAAIERGEGSEDAVVRGWLTRALTAPRGPRWVCEKCHSIHGRWSAICSNCEGFDTLSWREPPEDTGPSPTQTEMLPLIVGQPAPPPAADDTDAADTGETEVEEDAPGKAEPETHDKAAATPDPDYARDAEFIDDADRPTKARKAQD